MPSNHRGHPTIAFRPSSWARSIIEQRAALSDMYKKDFITRSCVYSNIVVVGKAENIQRIVDAANELRTVMSESYEELKEDYFAFAITLVDILDGAAYLFETKPPQNRPNYKAGLELERYRNVLEERKN